ncbi:MAG: hypothetical protein KGH49_02725 [Candidatus Micrarchaeota archaeon]|nr:hypothetical protein [Candidatus Micrarchaeota archaeon]
MAKRATKNQSEAQLLARLGHLNRKEERQSEENCAERQRILRQLAKVLRSQGR